ncbi:hypothetical protein SH1V18_34660 [Vallitalea longa]|uniref:Cytosine-specific methyltransferase n=1 Tax=Vallitalea longa TaxID=2936439 RepID=A0A9W5YE53_9FIRM|nr:DNA cytosine methyltransferase [Vallitalea longa]GKX30986.1 hypothetical protein SH1V18_34660 [Vallitalea longa]
MKVVDFFCGGGGFSEGFRQAGFNIVFAVDKWKPAVDTHHENHPNCHTIMDDIERISWLPDDEFDKLIPDTEIIIGSPPCVAFSNSNKSGKGDKSLGIRLLESYLRIIARKKFKSDSILKYWVLENVPNIEKYVKCKYTMKDLGLIESYNIDLNARLIVLNHSSGVYNVKYFGVASNRKRFLCGEFPTPQKTIVEDSSLVKLGDILKGLGQPKENAESSIKDPNYDFFMVSKNITDHHYIKEIAEFEWKKARRLKQDKGYMGRMSFPENLDKPARTVMATMSFSSRESMIFSYKTDRFRAPTIREIASIMSFPLDYKFYGNSIGIKYRLVGNSVPPKMSYAIARAIAVNENLDINDEYVPIKHANNLDFHNLNFDIFQIKEEKNKKITAKFKYHIPYLIINAYRVELTNYKSDFDNLEFKWVVELHKSQGKNAKKFVPKLNSDNINNKLLAKINKFYDRLTKELVGFNEFQKIFCLSDKNRIGLIGPYEILNQIKEFIDNNLSKEEQSKIVFLDDNPWELPMGIVAGYYLIDKLIEHMGDLNG